MSDLVRTLFPNIPERCQECPGIEAAALRLSSDLSLAQSGAAAALEFSESTNPEDLIGAASFYPVLSEAFARLAENSRQALLDYTGVLTGQCNGRISVAEASVSVRKWNRRSETPRAISSCGSAAIIAYFIPTQS